MALIQERPSLEAYLALGAPGPDRMHIFERDRQTQAYLRRGVRELGQRRTRTVTLASIEVSPPGQGHFTEFLDRLERVAAANGYAAVLIETVENRRLPAFLQRRDYRRIPGHYDLRPSDYWKPLA